MEIRRIREPELPAAMDLCWRVFQEFEAPDYPPEGVEAFYTYISNTEQVKHLTVFGAWERHQLLGVVAAEGSHIALFFVDPAVHRQGIGRRLFQTYLSAGGWELCDGPQLPLCGGGLPASGLFTHGGGTAVAGRHPLHAHDLGAIDLILRDAAKPPEGFPSGGFWHVSG